MVVAIGGVHAHLVALRWRLVGFKFSELPLHAWKREIIINIKMAAVDFSDNIGILIEASLIRYNRCSCMNIS